MFRSNFRAQQVTFVCSALRNLVRVTVYRSAQKEQRIHSNTLDLLPAPRCLSSWQSSFCSTTKCSDSPSTKKVIVGRRRWHVCVMRFKLVGLAGFQQTTRCLPQKVTGKVYRFHSTNCKYTCPTTPVCCTEQMVEFVQVVLLPFSARRERERRYFSQHCLGSWNRHGGPKAAFESTTIPNEKNTSR